MKREIFNQKSMERFSAPEQMNDYLRVTTPALWVILAAVILLLAALFLWSSVTAVESYASGTAEVENGVLTLRFHNADKGGAGGDRHAHQRGGSADSHPLPGQG